MKIKSFFYLAFALILSAGLSSCKDDDVVWDIAPQVFVLDLTDAQGHSLIDPNTPEGLALLDKITVEYNGQTYHPEEFKGYYYAKPKSRYYMPHFYGLCYTNFKDKGYSLEFGEFGRDENYKMSFTVTWPDGTKDYVDFSNKCSWHRNEPKIKSELKINGSKQKSSCIIPHILNE